MTKTETFADGFGAKFGFDPASIVAIITAIMEIFQNCNQSGEELRGTVRQPSRWVKARARRIVMKELEGVRRWQAGKIADDLMAEAAAQDDTTIDAIAAECCDPSHW